MDIPPQAMPSMRQFRQASVASEHNPPQSLGGSSAPVDYDSDPLANHPLACQVFARLLAALLHRQGSLKPADLRQMASDALSAEAAMLDVCQARDRAVLDSRYIAVGG